MRKKARFTVSEEGQVTDYYGSPEERADNLRGAVDELNRRQQSHQDPLKHIPPQVMFYDEFLYVICEGIEAKPGGFVA